MKPIEMLQKHCEFNDPNDCYVLLAVSRKKDTPEITNSQEIVFRKIIKKPEDIIRKYNTLKAECTNYKDEVGKAFPFYIYVSLNARDAYKATHLLLDKILHWFYEEKKGTDRSMMYKRIDGHFYSMLMKSESRSTSQRYFMIDYDEKKNFDQFLIQLEAKGIKAELVQETKNGFHVKTKPFDRMKYGFQQWDCEVKTDANLFIEFIEIKRKKKC